MTILNIFLKWIGNIMKIWYVKHKFIDNGILQHTRTSIVFSHEEDAWSYVEWSIKRLNKTKGCTITDCCITPRTVFNNPSVVVEYTRTVGDSDDGNHGEIHVICSTQLCEDFSKLHPNEDW